MARPKDIGTTTESAVVRALRDAGLPERILAKAVLTSAGCLEYTGALVNGYGRVGTGSRKHGNRRSERVHRLAWAAVNGEPSKNRMVCHQCDNRRCFNPDHLFLGTARDNTADMITKRRHKYKPHRGQANGRTRLNENQVREIRALADTGRSLRSIARDYGIAGGTVSSIVRRINWRWVA